MAGDSGPAGSGYRSALRHRDLRLLLGGLTISATGSWAYNVALLVYVYDRTGSLGWVAAAGLARFVPSLLLSPYAGVVVERRDRVRVMVYSDLACVGLQGAMAAVAAADGPAGAVIALGALTSIASTVYLPAVASTIPGVVGEDDLAAANALNGTVENLVVVVGPAIGAGLLAATSVAAVFAINAASSALSALIVSRMRVRTEPVDVTEEGRVGPLAQMLVGFRTLAGTPAARVPVALCVLVSFVYGTDTVLFVGVSDERLGTGADGFGYLLAGIGVGGVVAAAAVNRLAGSSRLALVTTGAAVLYCLPTALLTVIESPLPAFVLQIERGAATLIVDVLAVTALQRAVPSDRLARVFGVFGALFLGGIALGTLVTPPIVRALGLDGALLVMAFVPSALALLGLRPLAALDRDARARVAELEPRVRVLERLGIFAAAPRAVLERLAAACTDAAFATGQPILREGEPADALYVLLQGRVEVTAAGRALRTMHAEAYVGEIGLLDGIPRTATVRAAEDCRCYRIDGDAFLDALTATPAAPTLIEGARSRLALTHPARPLAYAGARTDG